MDNGRIKRIRYETSGGSMNSVRDFLNHVDLSGFGQGKYECKYYLRLNYNDGINRNLEINKKTAGMIREFLQHCFEETN